ncbi:MAG: protein kinase [Sandaracinus sp.]
MKICGTCGTRFTEPVAFCPNDGTPTTEVQDGDAPPPADPLLGRVIDGRYRVEKSIGEGGMGVVYLISHAVLGKRMALKVLRGEMAKDADVVQRFMQEAQSATSIGDPNIIDISDFGRLPDGSVYFVMEYLDGESLSKLIARGGSIPMATAIHVVRQIASALEAAHARGIVHRDLKPDNIYLVKQGQDDHFVKVLDFGIAKVGGANSKLTRTGMIFGTPHYMSPEQAAGQSVDQRTDIYALGVIMYEMFTGKVPFDGDTFMGILSKHMFEQPLPPSQVKGAGLGAIEDVILKALSKKQEERYQSMGALVADLDTISSGGVVQIGGRGVAPPGNLADALEPPSRTEMRLGQSVPTPEPAPRSRAPLFIAGFLGLLVIGGVAGAGAYVYAGGLATAAVPPTALAIAPPTTLAVPPATGGVAPPVTGAVPPPTALGAGPPPTGVATTPVPTLVPPPTTVALASVQIQSDPPGAEVLVDDALVGNTPVRVPRPTAGERSVTIRLRGYEDSRAILTSMSDETLSVTLHRASGGGGHRPHETSTSTAPPPSTTTAPPPSTTSGHHSQSEVVDPWN